MTDDEYLMPFGKHAGVPIGEVSASYLLWFADTEGDNYPKVRSYCRKNRRQLEHEKCEEDYIKEECIGCGYDD